MKGKGEIGQTMIFSKRSRYGIRALVDLAVYGQNTRVQLSEIANRNDISVKYLEQIFTALRKAGVIRSIKGPQGGYQLADRPENIHLSYIIEVLDGSYLLEAEEIVPGKTGETTSLVIQKSIIEPMNEMLENFLSGLTLENLMESFGEYTEYHQNICCF